MGILTRKTNIVVRTVTSEDFITGYIVDNVKIVKNKKCICTLDKIIVSFPNQTIGLSNRYSGLIGYNLYIEKMGGVFL